MSSLILDLHLTPDEARIILSALSSNIINYKNDSSMDEIVDEEIQVYKTLHEIVDKKWPNWLFTNEELKKILNS